MRRRRRRRRFPTRVNKPPRDDAKSSRSNRGENKKNVAARIRSRYRNVHPLARKQLISTTIEWRALTEKKNNGGDEARGRRLRARAEQLSASNARQIGDNADGARRSRRPDGGVVRFRTYAAAAVAAATNIRRQLRRHSAAAAALFTVRHRRIFGARVSLIGICECIAVVALVVAVATCRPAGSQKLGRARVAIFGANGGSSCSKRRRSLSSPRGCCHSSEQREAHAKCFLARALVSSRWRAHLILQARENFSFRVRRRNSLMIDETAEN